jgi:hypothetical protein
LNRLAATLAEVAAKVTAFVDQSAQDRGSTATTMSAPL